MTDGTKRPKLLLIDGNSVLYRAFFAVPLLSNSQGAYTNAVYGFAQMILNVLNQEQPTHIAVAFDKGKATFRHQVYEAYKGKRAKTPPELSGQFEMARMLLDQFHMRYLEAEDYEADDLIGTLARVGEEANFDVMIVTGDKDLLQLVSNRVTTCLTKKGTTDLTRYDPEGVRERFSLDPLQVIDLKGLMGDASDNIPGVPGVGEKTAIKLLTQYGSVEAVLDHIDEISGAKLQERLREHRELALLSKRLATIEQHAPLSLSLDDLSFTGFAQEDVTAAFRALEFKSLLARVRDWQGIFQDTPKKSEQRSSIVEDDTSLPTNKMNGSDGDADGSAAANADRVEGREYGEADVRIASLAELPEVIASLEGPIAILADGLRHYHTDRLAGVAFATSDHAVYVRIVADEVLADGGIGAGKGDQAADESDLAANERVMALSRQLAPLVDLLCDETREKVVFDAKAWRVGLYAHGVRAVVERPFAQALDALLGTYLLRASEGVPELADAIIYAVPELPIPESLYAAREMNGEPYQIGLAQWARMLARARAAMIDQLKSKNLWSLYEDVEVPLSYVLADMEIYGVKIDASRLEAIGAELAVEIERLTKRIYELAGTTFNINSTKQLGEILFEKMGLPPVKKTKTGYSTSADVLEKLAPQSEMVTEILRYRILTKLQSTYIEGLLREIRMPSSRIHTSFHQAKTATGRLSSEEPNLQNIPIRMEEGRRLRHAFVPSLDGWKMVAADYSQVELRIMAHLSRDEALVDAFMTGVDVHTRTASQVFGVPESEVTSLMRRQAKAVNFGIIYGISDFGLSQNLNVSRAQAGAFIEQYFAKFPGVRSYMDQAVAFAKEHGATLGGAVSLCGTRHEQARGHVRVIDQHAHVHALGTNSLVTDSRHDSLHTRRRVARSDYSPARQPTLSTVDHFFRHRHHCHSYAGQAFPRKNQCVCRCDDRYPDQLIHRGIRTRFL
ncbi:hypothetical protein AYJ22_06480 [Ferroacidibacillus organovorans]|nr:hypothetical protein AYJ22_06480 [Ferroacidibacillus organovorans]